MNNKVQTVDPETGEVIIVEYRGDGDYRSSTRQLAAVLKKEMEERIAAEKERQRKEWEALYQTRERERYVERLESALADSNYDLLVTYTKHLHKLNMARLEQLEAEGLLPYDPVDCDCDWCKEDQ